jgi:hypothetical protein
MSMDLMERAVDAKQDEKERKIALLARVRVMKENARSGVAVPLKDTDPGYVYLWAFNHPDRIAQLSNKEYELVGKNDKVSSAFKKPDGTHVRGDVILMRCKKETAEAFGLLAELDSIEQLGSKSDFENFAVQRGIPLFAVQRNIN